VDSGKEAVVVAAGFASGVLRVAAVFPARRAGAATAG
jgi:hypothetical protein